MTDKSTTPTDLLVQSASRGDGDALSELLTRFLPQLRAFVRLNMGDALRQREEPEDIEQSVCREILQDLSAFDDRGEAAFCQWLYLSALRKIRDRAKFYGRARRDVARERPIASHSSWSRIEALYADIASPSTAASAREEVVQFESAMDRLSEEQRRVIVRSRLQGMSHREIAAELGKSEGATRVLLSRSIAKLGMLMDEADCATRRRAR